MIQVLKHGEYRLDEAETLSRIFILDNSKYFNWNTSAGELTDCTKDKPKINSTLSIGKYFLYNVTNETILTNCLHLELLLGKRKWQAYILPLGFPTKKQRNVKILPTKEIITISRFGEKTNPDS